MYRKRTDTSLKRKFLSLSSEMSRQESDKHCKLSLGFVISISILLSTTHYKFRFQSSTASPAFSPFIHHIFYRIFPSLTDRGTLTEMQPTPILQKSLRRLALTTKQGPKDYYKGTGSGAMGVHTPNGGYKIIWKKVRTYQCPDLKGFKVRGFSFSLRICDDCLP